MDQAAGETAKLLGSGSAQLILGATSMDMPTENTSQ